MQSLNVASGNELDGSVARLARLVEHGIVERAPYRDDGQRSRYGYLLTERGQDLRPVLIALMRYGDKHLADAAGPPLELRHRDCGAPIGVEVVCAAGHRIEGLRVSEVAPRAGAGARRWSA